MLAHMELRLRIGDRARDALARRAVQQRRSINGEAEVIVLERLGLYRADTGVIPSSADAVGGGVASDAVTGREHRSA